MIKFPLPYFRRRRVRDFSAIQPPHEAGIFGPADLAAILALWAGVIEGQPTTDSDGLRLPLSGGGHVEITPTLIHIEDSNHTRPEALHAAMKHIAAHWQGRAAIELDPHTPRSERLRLRAYAEVYGIDLIDQNEAFLPLAFTRAELATLPALRREIRARHRDAPPERPDEERQLAAAYAARFPFRVPAAA